MLCRLVARFLKGTVAMERAFSSTTSAMLEALQRSYIARDQHLTRQLILNARTHVAAQAQLFEYTLRSRTAELWCVYQEVEMCGRQQVYLQAAHELSLHQLSAARDWDSLSVVEAETKEWSALQCAFSKRPAKRRRKADKRGQIDDTARPAGPELPRLPSPCPTDAPPKCGPTPTTPMTDAAIYAVVDLIAVGERIECRFIEKGCADPAVWRGTVMTQALSTRIRPASVEWDEEWMDGAWRPFSGDADTCHDGTLPIARRIHEDYTVLSVTLARRRAGKRQRTVDDHADDTQTAPSPERRVTATQRTDRTGTRRNTTHPEPITGTGQPAPLDLAAGPLDDIAIRDFMRPLALNAPFVCSWRRTDGANGCSIGVKVTNGRYPKVRWTHTLDMLAPAHPQPPQPNLSDSRWRPIAPTNYTLESCIPSSDGSYAVLALSA
jgi:hypothetical protein